MLEIRPNCECCNKSLPYDSTEAYICTYECTFCQVCVEDILHNVCPNCGGGFCPRPIRPKTARRAGVSVEHQPVSTSYVHSKYTKEEMNAFSQKVKSILPKDR